MIKCALHILGLACVAVVFSGAASAATVTPMSGKVLLNQGKGFKPVAGSTEAKTGDRVLVQPGGSAQITYNDGCTSTVTHGSVVVAETSPCALNETQESGLNGAGGLGGAGPVVVTVGAIAQGVIAGYRIQTRHDRDQPASP